MATITSVPAGAGKLSLVALMGTAAAGALLTAIPVVEGTKNIGYRDVAGFATACSGDTNDVQVGKFYSDAECRQRTERQAIAHVAGVLKCTPRVREQDGPLIAAGLFAYNVGVAGYCGSYVGKLFGAGKFREGCVALTRMIRMKNGQTVMAWTTAGGKQYRGLVNRRRYEQGLCLKGLQA